MNSMVWIKILTSSRTFFRFRFIVDVQVQNIAHVVAGATARLVDVFFTQHHGVEQFILMDGGVYTQLFWIVQIGLGSLLPLALLYLPATANSRCWIGIASLLVIIGGLAQMYITIIGGQAYPMELFPGKEVSSAFYDGVVAPYAPSLPEIVLGIGGIGIALAATWNRDLVTLVGVALGDVAGKGLAAALLMAKLQADRKSVV